MGYKKEILDTIDSYSTSTEVNIDFLKNDSVIMIEINDKNPVIKICNNIINTN